MKILLAFLFCFFLAVPAAMARPILYSGENLGYGVCVGRKWSNETAIKYDPLAVFGLEFRLYGFEREVDVKIRFSSKDVVVPRDIEEKIHIFTDYFINMRMQKQDSPYDILIEIIVDDAVIASKTFTILPSDN